MRSSYSSCQFCPCNLTQTNKWWIIWQLSAILPQAILLPDRGKYSFSSISSRDAFSPSYTQNGNLKQFWGFFCTKKALHGRPPFHCYPFQPWGRPCPISTRGWRTRCARRPRELTPSCGWQCQLKQQSCPVACSSRVRRQCLSLEIPSLPELRIPVWPGRGWRLHQAACFKDKAFLKVVSILKVRVNIMLLSSKVADRDFKAFL